MILGAWFHNADEELSPKQLRTASAAGLASIRSYNYSYVARLAPVLKSMKMSVYYRVNADYNGRIKAVYFYEWRDNLYHSKIQSENSPIHTCFGLCYSDGTPKFDLRCIRTDM
jgi:hypothetical protein